MSTRAHAVPFGAALAESGVRLYLHAYLPAGDGAAAVAGPPAAGETIDPTADRTGLPARRTVRRVLEDSDG